MTESPHAAENANLLRDMVLAGRMAGRRPTYLMPTWMVTASDIAW